MVSARERMLERGWSAASFLTFVGDCAAESRGNARARPDLVRAVVRFSAVGVAAIVAVCTPAYFQRGDAGGFLRFAVYSALSASCAAALAVSLLGLVRRPDGRVVPSLGLANHITLFRFFLIAPVLVLFAQGYPAVALTLYAVLGISDVADGVVARRRGQSTEFGVVMDPLADVFSNLAIFSLFLSHGLVPPWVFGLLIARYAMLFVGSFVLFLVVGPIRFRSTLPGKVVGVVQAAGAIVIIVCAMSDRAWLDRVGPVVFPVLGAGFASIVVSQAVIGWRHIRSPASTKRKAVEVGS